MWLPRSKRVRALGSQVARTVVGEKRLRRLKGKLGEEVDWDTLRRLRQENMVQVDQPLVLISQIQRSGGTLLSQLMDCHPECHTHPYELYIGHPEKHDWPPLDLSATPDEWFEMLEEAPARRSFRTGYEKYSRAAQDEWEKLPFLLPPSLQRGLFLHAVEQNPPKTRRGVLDAYWTSYFNGWLDNQNLYSHWEKKYVVGFVPRLSMEMETVRSFYADYPDGVLINIIRDPRSWYVSARRHMPKEYGDLGRAMELWKASCAAMLRTREEFAGKTHIVRFEDLVGDTEGVMRRLAEALSLRFDPIMLVPTFNRMLIKADSSYKVQSYGVIKDPLERFRKELSEADLAQIARETESDYNQVQSFAL